MNDYNELTRELLNAASHKLLEDTEDYIFAVDEALIYRAASDSVARMAGIDSAAAIIGRSDYDIFPVELAEKYRADDLRVMETGEPLEGIVERLPDLDGKPRWTKTWKSPVYSKSGRLLGLFGLSRDVTRIRSLEKTEKMAQRYAQLISNMPGGVGIIHIEDGEFVLDFANEGWARAHHHRYVSTNELIGRHLIEDIFDDDRELVRHEYEEVLEQRKTQGRVIYRAPGDDGKLHWVSALFRFAYESNGIRYYYASYTGMDEQKSAEAALLDSQSALREAVENSDIQFFTCFPEEKRCELYAVNSRLSQLPMTWKDFPDDFLEYTMATAEDAEAYRDMLRQIDEGADEAGCTVRFCYKGVYNWEKIIVKAVRDERGKTVKVQGYSINVNEKIGDEERYKASQLKSSVLDGNIFETFTLNLTGNSVIDIRTKDPAMLEQEITEDVLRDAFSICPALRESSSETRSVLLRAALRIPDKDEREMFIRKCSGDGVKKMINDGRRTMRIRYRRYVGEQIRWVSSSLEILNDPQSDDLTAFFYTTDITGDVMDDMLSKQIMQLNYETVSYCDLQTGELIIKDTKYEDTRQVSGRKYQEAMEWLSEKMENSGEFLKKFRLENLQAQLEATRTVTLYYAKKEKRRDLPGSPTKQLKCDIFYLDDNQDMLVFLISDITEIIENERENKEKMAGALIAARQASEAKSNFLSRMSHEIRTPLNAIIGMDTIAAQAIGQSGEGGGLHDRRSAFPRGYLLLSLINDILDMSQDRERQDAAEK
jgi:PAS domain S-box-containing protein